ncbi:hypothetical protein HNV28_23145 [Myxococcus xanthus]|uniref:Uncharacterized protein n=1 Tax=Myxococcus xanthus TaxID=34 RepID=A0A7Y4IL81_MYXXA|nr:hypothetical protein [Myxococcus xanthus]
MSPGCQVRIRSAREDFQGGQQLAHSLFEVLHQTPYVPSVTVRAEESVPVYLGTDTTDRHRWILNIALRYLNVLGV